MKPCPHCGAAVANKATACATCGTHWTAELGSAPATPDVRPAETEAEKRKRVAAEKQNRELEWWRHVIHGPFELLGAGGRAAYEVAGKPLLFCLFLPSMTGAIGYEMFGWLGLVGGIIAGFAVGVPLLIAF